MSILDRFVIHKDLGKGSYGSVKLAEEKGTGKYFALKFIAKESLKKRSQLIRVNREIRLLKMLNHPFIIKIFEADETESDIIMVMEYVPGGELFEYVQQRKKGLPEAQAMEIFCQILSAIEYCHCNRIIHRDLKPENVLLDSEGRVKLIDFGFSNVFDPRAFSNTFCGSPYYAAPEVIEGQQYVGPEADVWSLGIILYILVSGRLPFVEDNLKKLCAKIKALDYTIPNWVSKGAKDLIRRLLTIDRNARITMTEIKNHYWLKEAVRMHFIHPLDVVPRRLPIIGVDELVVKKLESYNFFPKESLLTRIFNDTESPQFACYYLLKERFLRELQRQPQKQHVIVAEEDAMTTVGYAHGTKPNHPLALSERKEANKLKLASNAVQPLSTSLNRAPKPDLELFAKGDSLVQEMGGYRKPEMRTKIVVRRLPSDFDVSKLFEDDGELAKWKQEFSYYYFVPGKVAQIGRKDQRFSRLYITFKDPEKILAFQSYFQTLLFVQDSPPNLRPVIEFAPFQNTCADCYAVQALGMENHDLYKRYLESKTTNGRGNGSQPVVATTEQNINEYSEPICTIELPVEAVKPPTVESNIISSKALTTNEQNKESMHELNKRCEQIVLHEKNVSSTVQVKPMQKDNLKKKSNPIENQTTSNVIADKKLTDGKQQSIDKNDSKSTATAPIKIAKRREPLNNTSESLNITVATKQFAIKSTKAVEQKKSSHFNVHDSMEPLDLLASLDAHKNTVCTSDGHSLVSSFTSNSSEQSVLEKSGTSTKKSTKKAKKKPAPEQTVSQIQSSVKNFPNISLTKDFTPSANLLNLTAPIKQDGVVHRMQPSAKEFIPRPIKITEAKPAATKVKIKARPTAQPAAQSTAQSAIQPVILPSLQPATQSTQQNPFMKQAKLKIAIKDFVPTAKAK